MHKYELEITYCGFDPRFDLALDKFAEAKEGLRLGSGFAFGSKERDVQYTFKDKVSANEVAAEAEKLFNELEMKGTTTVSPIHDS